MTISLEKFENNAPELLGLAKKAKLSLSKFNLDNIIAEVAFVFDASGSMIKQYQQNSVQQTLNRVFPLATHFDDNQSLETWAFAQEQQKMSPVTFSNYKNYVNNEKGGWKNWMQSLNSGYNNEPVVIRDIIKHFTGLDAPSLPKTSSKFFGLFAKNDSNNLLAPIQSPRKPIWILFLSDGGVSHNEDIEFLIKWSSSLPIFWQFIGIGGHNYGALEKLDDMQNRFLDNADFFSIPNLDSISEQELYDKMIQEFPSWISLAKKKNIIS
jgi:hypothetical protein